MIMTSITITKQNQLLYYYSQDDVHYMIAIPAITSLHFRWKTYYI